MTCLLYPSDISHHCGFYFFLEQPFGTIRCSRFIWCISCPSTIISHFSNGPDSWENGIKNQDLVLSALIASGRSSAIDLFLSDGTRSYVCIVTCACSVQFSSVTQSCPTLCDPMNRSMPGLPIHYQLLELTQTHLHRVGDAIQPSHPLLSPSPPAPNPSQHQGLFQ